MVPVALPIVDPEREELARIVLKVYPILPCGNYLSLYQRARTATCEHSQTMPPQKKTYISIFSSFNIYPFCIYTTLHSGLTLICIV